MKTANIPIRITESERSRLESIAKKRGITLTELMRQGVTLIDGFDNDFYERFENFCKKLNLPAHLVIQNIITSWMGIKAAEENVYPKSTELLMEFTFSSSGPLPSQILFENVRADYQERLESNKELRIRCRLQNGAIVNQKDINWLKTREETIARLKKECDAAEIGIEPGINAILRGDELQRTIDAIKKRAKLEKDN